MSYLVRYTSNGATIWAFMNAQEIAQSIANPNHSDHRIWRLLPNAEPLAVKIRNVSKYCEVWLFDRFDNFIESGTYSEIPIDK